MPFLPGVGNHESYYNYTSYRTRYTLPQSEGSEGYILKWIKKWKLLFLILLKKEIFGGLLIMQIFILCICQLSIITQLGPPNGPLLRMI